MLLDTDSPNVLRRRIADGIAKALKVASGNKPDEAIELLHTLCVTELGMELSVLSMLDPKSAVDLLGSHQRVLGYLTIVEAIADLEQARDPARALKRYQQAFHVAAVLQERDGSKQPLVEIVARLLQRFS